MQLQASPVQDWRDAAAYAPLLECDRSLFAWEWLRRDPLYRESAARAASGVGPRPAVGPERFGLLAFERPHLGVPYARPFWRLDVHPYVLRVERVRAASPLDMVDLRSLQPLASILVDQDGDHLLLSDGFRMLRLDGPAASLTGSSGALRYIVEGLAAAEPPLLTVRRFLALCRTGRFARSLHVREARARRWVQVLRTADALASGAGQRSIAVELLSASEASVAWRGREPSLRSQAQRLVRAARHLARGGYRRLLGPPVARGFQSPEEYLLSIPCGD